MVELKNIVLVSLCIVTFIFLAASCGGTQWMKTESNFAIASSIEIGIWKYCTTNPAISIYVSEVTQCYTFKPSTIIYTNWMKATQAFSILAVLSSIGATVLAVLTLFIKRIKLHYVSIVMAVPCICGIIALAIFTGEINNHKSIILLKLSYNFVYGWSYALGWVGSIFALITAVFGIVLNADINISTN